MRVERQILSSATVVGKLVRIVYKFETAESVAGSS